MASPPNLGFFFASLSHVGFSGLCLGAVSLIFWVSSSSMVCWGVSCSSLLWKWLGWHDDFHGDFWWVERDDSCLFESKLYCDWYHTLDIGLPRQLCNLISGDDSTSFIDHVQIALTMESSFKGSKACNVQCLQGVGAVWRENSMTWWSLAHFTISTETWDAWPSNINSTGSLLSPDSRCTYFRKCLSRYSIKTLPFTQPESDIALAAPMAAFVIRLSFKRFPLKT